MLSHVPEIKIPDDPINRKLCALLNEGKDGKAVKLERETFGLSLIESKHYVDVLKNQWKDEEDEKSH
ncbi:hypothetical protein GCM10010954_10370 [Halobacillus andaensis]|uniref:Uncharacterized protein n=1 Tax=Halobacillus andaensis TaxID=1176239 RepID=A0A917EVS7_HALAA|nr:hypothetical protein GCM10010954_10370 [Halobacillus andaensis]